ncbi:sigma factor [Cetobacterium sp. SF1]|uniref:sigma factor n=1 Tax=Cetobacterium sp. SF1 TaxID=3417654 RepID=UPI003CF99AF2
MIKLTIDQFENEVLRNLREEEEFYKFLKENKGLELLNKRIGKVSVEKIGQNYFLEDMVAEFLEEISHNLPLSEEEEKQCIENIDEDEFRDTLVTKYLREIAKLSFNYLKSGIDYMDLIQEGTIAMLENIDNYKESYGKLKDFIRAVIIRNYILYIEDKLDETKYEYISYLTNKKLHEEESVENQEDIEEVVEDEEIEEIKEEKIDIKKIDEKLKEVTNINYSKIPNKLTEDEIDILNLYFGFTGDKRESIFEIEESLGLERGEGEALFMNALNKVSTVGGRLFRI